MTGARDPRPLDGLRIVITRPKARSQALSRELRSLGAHVLSVPLITIDHPPRLPALDAELRAIDSYDWIAFTSVHAVGAVFRRLSMLGGDESALRSCFVAAVGPATALELRKQGVEPDLIPRTSTAEGLARALGRVLSGTPARILHPTSDRSLGVLGKRLSVSGHRVLDVVAYRTRASRAGCSPAQAFGERADGIVVCSPSAVQALRDRGPVSTRARLTCIGTVTAQAARRQGFRVHAVAKTPTTRGLAEAIVRAFQGQP